MQLDPIFLIAIGGMVMMVAVLAIFMGRNRPESPDTPNAVIEVFYEDDLAVLRRHVCPNCGQLLRQTVQLTHPQRPHQTTRAEIGSHAGGMRCPNCDALIQISDDMSD